MVLHVFDAPDPANTAHRLRAARRRRRLWTAGLWTLAGVVAVLAALTVAVNVARLPSPAPGATARSSTTTSSTTTSVPAGTLTTASGSNPPTITSVTPASGTSGQSVLVTGTNFVSANGRIVASFAGVSAPTSCSSSTACTTTAPPQPGTSSQVQVTITTATGTSNGAWFTYQ